MTLLGNMHTVGLGRRFLVMARQQTMPKAVSSLQSVQRLYISDNEAEKKKDQLDWKVREFQDGGGREKTEFQ
jgi:hypothetical protein